MKQHSHKCREKVKTNSNSKRSFKMADTNFREKKWENNTKKISWTGYNSPKRCLAVPYPNAKQEQGPPNNLVIPKHREKNLELILPKKTKKIPQNGRNNKSQNYWQYQPNLHHCLRAAVILKQFLYEFKKNIYHLRFKPLM